MYKPNIYRKMIFKDLSEYDLYWYKISKNYFLKYFAFVGIIVTKSFASLFSIKYRKVNIDKSHFFNI